MCLCDGRASVWTTWLNDLWPGNFFPCHPTWVLWLQSFYAAWVTVCDWNFALSPWSYHLGLETAFMRLPTWRLWPNLSFSPRGCDCDWKPSVTVTWVTTPGCTLPSSAGFKQQAQLCRLSRHLRLLPASSGTRSLLCHRTALSCRVGTQPGTVPAPWPRYLCDRKSFSVTRVVVYGGRLFIISVTMYD